MNQVSRVLTRKVIMSNRERRDEGFSLLEMIIAVTVLALVITFISTDLVASSRGTQRSQSRLVAQQIASKTIQQVESLGYETASEGVQCTSSSCTALAYPDPLGQIQYQNTGNPSTSCFYYVPSGTTLNPATDSIVPGQFTSAQNDSPIVPNVTTTGTSFPKPVVDGTTYSVVVYPMFNQASPTYSGVNCANELNDTAPGVPLTVIVEVSWGSGNAQHVSMQTMLYDGPQTSYTAGNCPTPAAESGSHNEQLMADQGVNATGPWSVSNASGWTLNTNSASSMPVSAGAWVSVMFLDEQATPYTPSVCIADGNGNTADVPLTSLITPYPPSCSSSGAAWCPLGTSSSNPYYNGAMYPVHGSWSIGSSPNAGKTPTGGTWCTNSTCALEVVFSFQVPSTAGGLTVKSLTVADWDHEGDLDFATWSVS